MLSRHAGCPVTQGWTLQEEATGSVAFDAIVGAECHTIRQECDTKDV
jgi:hypothetical protein